MSGAKWPLDLLVTECGRIGVAYFSTHGQPIHIRALQKLVLEELWKQREIYDSLSPSQKVNASGLWRWNMPDEDSVDRCINWASDKKYFRDGRIPTLAHTVQRGWYIPNPDLYEEEGRERILRQMFRVMPG